MNLRHTIYLLAFLFLVSCGEDDVIPADRTVLNYDGDNITAPTLAGGLYEFAARFPPVLVSNVEGRSIEQVSFYLYEVPTQLYINISTDETPSLPGEILNTQLVTNLTPNSWNTITLNEPYPLDGSAVWVGIEVTIDDLIQTVGCDAGPANANGDWLYNESERSWDTFRNLNGESVNWNIRAVISDD